MSVHQGKYKQTVENAEKISHKTLDLPIYGDLTLEEIDCIIEEIKNIQKGD